MINEPELIKLVLKKRPKNLPKSPSAARAVRPSFPLGIFIGVIGFGRPWTRSMQTDGKQMRGDSHRAKPICRFQAVPGSVRGGFAMAEAAVLLTAALRQFRFAPLATPVPVSHLRVRSRDGTTLEVRPH
jgi:hypothetical protein